MSTQTKNFQGFFDAMLQRDCVKARSYVVGNGDVPAGFRGQVASGIQESTYFEDCVKVLTRLLDAFTVGEASNMKVAERGMVVTATYQLPITYNGGTFTYRKHRFTFSTEPIVAEVISTVTFDANGKIIAMETQLANKNTVVGHLRKG